MKTLRHILLLSLPLLAYGEAIRSVPLVEADFTIDAVLDEKAWEDALVVKMDYEVYPGDSIPAPVSTKAYLLDNGDSLLAAFIAYDPEPEQIRAFYRDRDSLDLDDYVGLILDTFNDQRRALEFYVNPYGSQEDAIYSSQGGGGTSWDAIWESAGKINNDGYIVEIKIPYKELQMPEVDDKKVWGIFLYRGYPRSVEHEIRNAPKDRANSCYLCQMDEFSGFSNAKSGLDLEITPSITAGVSRNQPEGETLGDFEIQVEPSLDINWGIRSNLTLNATLNPDYSQVEADAAKLDVNNTFNLFFPEKRSFFLENMDYFKTPLNIVHTRNIALPEYGLRLVGKSDENAYGTFFTNDTQTTITIPGLDESDSTTLNEKSTNAVVRFRRDIGNDSTIGFITTNRETEDYYNRTAGVDLNYRFSESNKLAIQYLYSMTEYDSGIVSEFEQPGGTLQGSAFETWYTHNGDNLNYEFGYESIGNSFRADLGYIPRVGWNKATGTVWYNHYSYGEQFWDKMQPLYEFDISKDHRGKTIEREHDFVYKIEGPWQSYLKLHSEIQNQFWKTRFFDQYDYGFTLSAKPFFGTRTSIAITEGQKLDFTNSKVGDFLSIKPGLNFNLGPHWNINTNHKYQTLTRDGGTVFKANQLDFRTAYQFDLRHRLRLSLIYTEVDRDQRLFTDDIDEHKNTISSQLLYSYKINPKTVFYLGYSDTGLQDDDSPDFTVTNRTVFVKFSYAWKK